MKSSAGYSDEHIVRLVFSVMASQSDVLRFGVAVGGGHDVPPANQRPAALGLLSLSLLGYVDLQ